ncbi:MAG: CTB family bacteriocin [Leptolyngbyaceae cyanobacterium bins.302]|nr:CTB family bacteriocin [Leptolyngbyaceae cyanobacterium bins.302]
MMTEFQMETLTVETASLSPIAVEATDSAAMVQLGEDELDLCSGGANNAGSSNSGFSRNRMAMTKGTFAGPEGSGSFQTVMTEEIDSFANETWDITQ